MGTIIRIDRSKPFDPAKFLGKGWTIDEQDKRSLALTKVDLSAVRLEIMFRDGDRYVDGEEYLRRLKRATDYAATDYIRLDAKVLETILKNKDRIPENLRGECLYFDGTIIRDPYGHRLVLHLYRYLNGGQCTWHRVRLDEIWGPRGPSAVLLNSR